MFFTVKYFFLCCLIFPLFAVRRPHPTIFFFFFRKDRWRCSFTCLFIFTIISCFLSHKSAVFVLNLRIYFKLKYITYKFPLAIICLNISERVRSYLIRQVNLASYDVFYRLSVMVSLISFCCCWVTTRLRFGCRTTHVISAMATGVNWKI